MTELGKRRRALIAGRSYGQNGLIPGRYDSNRCTVISNNRIFIDTTSRNQAAYLPIKTVVPIRQGDQIDLYFTYISGTQSGGRWLLGIYDFNQIRKVGVTAQAMNLSSVKIDSIASENFDAVYIAYMRESSTGGVTDCVLDVTMKVNNEVIF